MRSKSLLDNLPWSVLSKQREWRLEASPSPQVRTDVGVFGALRGVEPQGNLAAVQEQCAAEDSRCGPQHCYVGPWKTQGYQASEPGTAGAGFPSGHGAQGAQGGLSKGRSVLLPCPQSPDLG
jgi:hypothetical protein